MSYSANVDGTGYFHLTRVPPGDYRARVIGPNGETLETTYVSVGYSMPMLMLRISGSAHSPKEAMAPGTVAFSVLEHKIPADARKEMEQAEKAARKNQTATAIQHLRKAVMLDPQYLEAHNTLGMRYIQSNQFDLALDEFRKAAKLDPRNPTLQANLSATLLHLRQAPEAESAARRAVDLDGASARAHYLLALSMLGQDKRTQEVEKNLRDAAEKIPVAHLMLGEMLIDSGRVDDATTELKAYLATGSPAAREKVQQWLKKRDESRAEGAGKPVDAGALATEKK